MTFEEMWDCEVCGETDDYCVESVDAASRSHPDYDYWDAVADARSRQ